MLQAIGAYTSEVATADDDHPVRQVTFLDTPGHEVLDLCLEYITVLYFNAIVNAIVKRYVYLACLEFIGKQSLLDVLFASLLYFQASTCVGEFSRCNRCS